MNYQVYVISKDGKPLMPTKRFGKVRRLLDSGKAKVVRRNPFTIQLLYETSKYTQPLTLGIDPGTGHIGLSVRNEEGEVVFGTEITTRSLEVAEKMRERKMQRRARRNHRRDKRKRKAKKAKTVFSAKPFVIAGMKEKLLAKAIRPKLVRFKNRKRKQGWLTPTAHHLLQTHINAIKRLRNMVPISQVYLEYGQFDMQKLENPFVSGKEYQQGKMAGFANAREYVLFRDQHTCQLCRENKVSLHVHHVIWRSQGGKDSPENLVTLCHKCHDKVHKNPKTASKLLEIFQGLEKRYVPATLLNTIMPFLFQWLGLNFPKVNQTYGYETKEKRRKWELPKSHFLDAYLISFTSESKPKVPGFVKVYRLLQFRRHNRQLIHAVRDRNYILEKRIVAKNRRKRTGQVTDSLYEWLEKNGKACLHKLKVVPGKKLIRRKIATWKAGDVVQDAGQAKVVKGYGDMGRQVGFANQKGYYRVKHLKPLIKNTGLVCTNTFFTKIYS